MQKLIGGGKKPKTLEEMQQYMNDLRGVCVYVYVYVYMCMSICMPTNTLFIHIQIWRIDIRNTRSIYIR